MRAQFVYENINFERGRDPKSSMKIGKAKEKEWIREVVWDTISVDLGPDADWDYEEIYLQKYRAYLIKVNYIENKVPAFLWTVLVPGITTTDFYPSKEGAIGHAKHQINYPNF